MVYIHKYIYTYVSLLIANVEFVISGNLTILQYLVWSSQIKKKQKTANIFKPWCMIVSLRLQEINYQLIVIQHYTHYVVRAGS